MIQPLLSLMSFLVVACVSISSHAATPASSFPESAFKLKRYEEVQRLSPLARAKYLEQMRELMVDLERMHQPDDVEAKKKSKDLKAYLQLLEVLIDEAQAQRRQDAGTVPRVRRNTGWFARNANVATCGNGLIPVRIGGSNSSHFICRTSNLSQSGCPSGFIAVNRTHLGYFSCASRASFDRLPAGVKAGIRRPNAQTLGNANVGNFVRGGPNLTPRVLATAAAPPRSRNRAARPQARAQREVDRSSNEREVAQPVETDGTTSGLFNGVELETTDLAAADVEARDRMIAQCVDGNVPENANACNDEVIESARASFYNSPRPLCLYAGNFSYYSGANPEPGRCSPPREFCFGRLSCRDRNGELGTTTPDLVCPSNTVICNPYIYSVKSDGKPFCVSQAENATEACNAATQWPAGSAKEGEPYVDRLKNHFLHGFAATDNSRISGITDGYNQFVDQMNEMCFTSENSKKFFCRECQMMKRRALYMNAQTIKPDCSGFEAMVRVPVTGAPAAPVSPAGSSPNSAQ